MSTEIEKIVQRAVAQQVKPIRRKLDAILAGQQYHPVTRSDFSQPAKKTPREIARQSVGMFVTRTDEGLQTAQRSPALEWIAGENAKKPTQAAQGKLFNILAGRKMTPREAARASMGLPIRIQED